MGKGNEKVSTAERELDTQYVLYEADDLIASHNDTGKVNPDYPAELQPRDRTRQASEDQIRGIASKLNPKLLGANPLASSGAPIIGSDRVVESGNGRVSAIRKAYRNHPEKAKAYQEHLKKSAESFGLKPESVDNFKQPILVRQRQGEMDTDQRIAFTKEANARDTASMSPAEKAKLDASRITQEDLSHFDTDDTGDLLHRSNDVFLARFADRLGSEAGELKTRQGDWNKQMRDRVESALFMKAYDDERLNSLFAEDDKPDLKNLIKSLAMAAPHFARAKGIDPELGGYGVIESLVEASRILQDSRNRNQSVDEILDQHSLLDSFSPETELFARWLDANLHKSKQVGQALSELAIRIEQYLQKQSQADGDMFGTAEATLDDLINQTNNQLEKSYGDKSTPIKDPKQSEKAEPVQTAEGSNRSSEQKEREGRTTDLAPRAEREAAKDEVDDLLDVVDDGTLDSDEWSDDDFAGIEEGSPDGSGQYNSRNAPHHSVPGFKNLGSPERAAIKRYLDNRSDKQGIIQRLKKLADTPWARKTVQAMLIRQTINDLVAGRKVDYRSLLSDKNNASILKALKDHGEKGLWRYLHTEDLIGHAGKPQNSINGSFVDCLPSRDCASFCYATKGNYRFSNPLIKSELVSWAVEKDPIKSAKIAANNYRGTQEYYQNKALRLFDMGDGSMEWLPFIKEMNKEGIRLQIFSKNPEFLKQVPEQNWRALSVDDSNFELTAQHPDLPLAVVLDGQKKGIDFVRSNLDRILVILPIKQGQKVLADKATLRRMLGIDAMKRLCPIDGGWKKIKHPTEPKKDFNCTSCDKYGGMGCFHGNVTGKVMKAATEAPHDKNLQRLKEEIENDPERYGGKESAAELLGNLGKIRSALRASDNTRTEEADAGSKGQDAEGTIGLRQIDEPEGKYDPHGRGKSRRTLKGVKAQERERHDPRGRDRTGEVNDEQDPDGPRVVKLRGHKRDSGKAPGRKGKKSDPAASGQRDLFASLDLSGEQRKQQIVQNQRVLVKHVETGTIRVGTDTLKDVRDVGHFIAPIRKLAQEEMYAIVLDANDKVINVIKHSKGQKSQATVSTWTLAGAVVAPPEAKSVWFAHNHPSGEATPSWADQGITWHLNDVLDGSGVVNNGHVVVSKGSSFHAMDADGQMLGAFQAEALPRKQSVAVTERQLRKNDPKFQVSSPDTAKPILDAISPNALVLLNTQHKITGILPLSDSDLSTLRFPGDPAVVRIMKALDSTNSTKVIIKTGNSTREMNAARNLTRFFNRGDKIEVLDHFYTKGDTYQSGAETGANLGETGAFYAWRNNKAKGVQSGPLRLKLRPLENELGQAIHVLQSESELPSRLYQEVMKDKALGRVKGMFDPATGETYLIAANLDNAGEAVRTVLHEMVGHKGVRSLLGNRLDTVLDEIHRDMNDRLKQALAKRYERQIEGKSEAEANRIIAEEYLAHLAEKDPKNGLLTKVVSMIRNALRRLFPNIKWTDADAVELLAAARRKLKRNGSNGPQGPKGNRYNDAGRAPTFYSSVERSAAAVKSDRLPAQSWLNAIKKGNNVQDEEVQWLGLDLWLADKKGEKLSKAEVLDFIRQNEVKITEDLNVDGFDEQELEDRIYDKQRDFIRERIGDYEHGYSLDELGDALEEAREDLRESEYDYHYEEIKQRYEDEELDDHEAEALLDDDGDLNESVLHEEAQWRANNSVDNMDDKELARDHVSYSDKEDAALEAWENDYESDYRSDMEAELRDESDVQYRQYAMQGGEDYSELILFLDNNKTVFPADHPNHKNRNPITEEEAGYLSQGVLPHDLKVNDSEWGAEFRHYTLYRVDADGNRNIITTGHASAASAIAAAVSEHHSFARWEQDAYTDSHWGEAENALAHVRFQTFNENVHGRNEQILFIDEVQSDWHQQGRERGYQTPEAIKANEEWIKKIDALRKEKREKTSEEQTVVTEIYMTKDRLNLLNEQMANEEGWNDWGDQELKEKLQPQIDQARGELKELNRRKDELLNRLRQIETELESLYSRNSAMNTYRMKPDAPLKENWPNLVMKRMIRHAAEEGFDRIAWSSAAQQVERYPSLGQVVDSLKVTPVFTSSGRLTDFTMVIKQRNGNQRHERIAEERLEDYVGNQVGANIRQQSDDIQQRLKEREASYELRRMIHFDKYEIIDANGEVMHDPHGDSLLFRSKERAQEFLKDQVYDQHQESFTLDNLDEVIGDSGARGMKEFYDKRLANYMKKYTKKWGAKLEPVDINFNGSQYPYDTKPDTVWSVTVTDKMKDSVLKDGQPLFALKGALKDKKQAKKSDDSPRYALKDDLPDDVQQVIKDIHGATQPKSPMERFKEWWDWGRIQRQVNQGVFNPYAAVEHNEKLLNEGKLLDASLSASKAAFLTRNLDNVMEVMLHEGTPQLKDGSVVIKEGSMGLLDVLHPTAKRNELEIWETWAGSLRSERIMAEDKAARTKGNQLLAQGQALKETLDAIAPDEYPGGRSGWQRDMKQANKDLKEGRELSQQNRENLYDHQKIKTIQNWVNTQPQLKQRFQQVKDNYQAHNKDLLDFLTDAGLIDRELRKVWETDDYLPFHRVHDLEGKEQTGGRTRRGLSGQKSGIEKLKGGVEKISPLEAMHRNTRSMLDAAFKNIAQQRIVEDGLAVGALEEIDTAIRITDDDVISKLKEMEQNTNLPPEQMKRWKSLLAKYSVLGEGTVSVSVNGKLKTYLVNDPLLLASIQDLGAPTHSTLLELVGIPRKVLTKAVTALPDFMFRNIIKDTISTAVHIAPEVNGKPLSLNPLAGAVRGFRQSLKNDKTRWAMMMGGGSGGGYYNITSKNIRKKLSPDEQKKILNKPGQLWDLWEKIGSRFENSNRLHVYDQVIKQGGSPAEAAYQAMDVLNFTRSGQWPIIQFMVQSLPFFNSMLQGVNRLWRGIKPGDKLDLASFSGSVLIRGLGYGLAAWALMRHYEDDERYKKLKNHDKLGYHHFWIGEGEDGHYRIPKPFEVGAIFASLPEIITQSLDGSEDMKWTKDMLYELVMNTFALDPIPQLIKPIWEVSENRDRFRDKPIIPMRLQNLKPEAQYDPYTSDTLKELAQLLPEGAPDWMRSPKKLEHLLKGYFGSLGTYVLMATDVMTRETTGAGELPSLRKRDIPLVGSFVQDDVAGSNRYTDEFHDMHKDVTEIAASIKRYQESSESERAKELELSAAEKLRNKKGLQKASRQISKLRKEVRKVMEDKLMSSDTKRQRVDVLNRKINQTSTDAVKRYQQPFR
ncbi:LPD38 domain-containing protein [Endozoicomonas acroporae]|uniref:LPD38 domain-containing protein n=1 Tax=Endozoicomonas acroporae TaxID=1701104 RepID=UPI001C60CD27|nr:LPD38 domain-containing protein [Endozoicomonas acroporae]